MSCVDPADTLGDLGVMSPLVLRPGASVISSQVLSQVRQVTPAAERVQQAFPYLINRDSTVQSMFMRVREQFCCTSGGSRPLLSDVRNIRVLISS